MFEQEAEQTGKEKLLLTCATGTLIIYLENIQ